MNKIKFVSKVVDTIELDYKHYYILSFFHVTKETTVSQLMHVFHGKRTPSMFYLAEINQWYPAFSQFKHATSEGIEKMMQPLLRLEWIKEAGKGYVATAQGSDARTSYFSDHYYPKDIKGFSNMTIRVPFWERLQLFVQAFSEMSYGNNKYSPIIKHPHHQENVRQLFRQFHTDKNTLLKKWVQEQWFLFNEMDETQADVLTSQLTGHQKVGETKAQIQEKRAMERLEYFNYHQDAIERLITVIQEHSSELSIHFAIFTQLQKELNFGLSASTNETYQLILQGHSIADIAKMRYLKENTVREHILEMAFVLKDFPFAQFVPKEIYDYLNQRFEAEEQYPYKQAVSEKETLEFMHYRLVELERIRKK